MAEPATKTPAKASASATPPEPHDSGPFDNLRREVDRLFDDFGRGFWRSPFRRPGFDIEPFRRDLSLGAIPAVDIAEKDDAFEVSMELPGLDEKQVEAKVSNGTLTITGEKSEESEEKKKDYFLRERHYGSFQRSFRIPEGVDEDKIKADFKKGVLTVTMPKLPGRNRPEKKVDIKAG